MLRVDAGHAGWKDDGWGGPCDIWLVQLSSRLILPSLLLSLLFLSVLCGRFDRFYLFFCGPVAVCV